MSKDILRWCKTQLPQFRTDSGKQAKALVLPGAFYGECVSLMTEAGFTKAKDVSDADVVVFIGGADIHPKLYNQKVMPRTYANPARDDFEKAIYEEAVKQKKVCFGICRGAQFLHAMNGGELWQDVNNHAGRPHDILDLEEDVVVTSTSLHHQMLQLNDEISVLAVTAVPVATKFEDDKRKLIDVDIDKDLPEQLEIEAGYYEKTRCFFVQGHPEIGSPEYRSWTMSKFHDLFIEWEISYIEEQFALKQGEN